MITGTHLAVTFLFVVPVARAWTWYLAPSPRQCESVNIRVAGSDALTPYRALIIPYGPLPLDNAANRIYEVPFDGKDWFMIDVKVRYPAGTQFIDLVSDARGFEWGGTSLTGRTVLPSHHNDYSCLDQSPLKLPFTFSLYPYRLSQCEETRIYWNADDVHGIPSFLAVVPGGEWFAIPTGTIDDRPGFGRGFTWRPPILAGSTVVIIAGDIRGNASGGSIVTTVQYGTSFTTPWDGSPGTCPTGTATGTISYPLVTETLPNTEKKGNFNAGIGVGVAIGFLAGLTFLYIFYLFKGRRRRRLVRDDRKPVEVPEKKLEFKRVQAQIHVAGQARPALPEPMSTPGPTMQNVPNVSQGNWSSPHWISSADISATVVNTLTDKGSPVLLHPYLSMHPGIHMETGLEVGRPLSTTGTLGGDTIFQAAIPLPEQGKVNKSALQSLRPVNFEPNEHAGQP